MVENTYGCMESFLQNERGRDFPGGPVVKNPPCNSREEVLIPDQGTKISHATELLSLRATTRESMSRNGRSHMTQLRPDAVNKLKNTLLNDSGKLLWCLSGEESTCQCKIHRFDP